MLPALGAASSLLDALQSLTQTKPSSPPTTGFSQTSSNPFDLSGSATPPASPAQPPVTGFGGSSQLSPVTMSALLAAQSQSSAATPTPASTSPSDALKDLFSKLDANGDGQISKSEFENALGAGGTNITQADDVFNKMDTNGDGNISLDEMTSALKGAGGKGGHHHHHHVADSDGSSDASGIDSSGGTSQTSSDPLLQALNGASSTSTSNSDGSTTTSVTYADGSKVTMTSPATTASPSSATSSYNFLEQMIQREAQALSFSSASLSVSI
jgi:Ca2+-binding EF-hand superfamily protein